MSRLFAFFTFALLLLTITVFAQRGTPDARRMGTLHGNNIKTVFTNSGVIAQPTTVVPRGAWMYENNGYIGDLSFMIGVELPIKDYTGDGIADTLHWVGVTPVDRPNGSGGKYGNGGKSWNFEPLPGYYDPSFSTLTRGVAMSSQPESWPKTPWPDHPEWGTGVWNGLNGPNTFTGDEEAYFVVDDNNDEQFTKLVGYHPDSTDLTRSGMGLQVSIRYIQSHNPLFKDILFRIYDIKNTGTTVYKKVVFGNLYGTYIGGTGTEWNDDVALYYPRENAVICSEFDQFVSPSDNPKWVGKVGMFSDGVLKSPNGITNSSFYYFVPAKAVIMSENEAMWKNLTPGKIKFPSSVIYDKDSIPHALSGADGDYMTGTNYFSLLPGETKRIAAALCFGYTSNEIFNKLKLAEAFYNLNFDTTALRTSINLTTLNSFQKISGTCSVKWNFKQTGGTVEIWLSDDAGKTWKQLESNLTNSGAFSFNTALYEDCAFGKLRIFGKNQAGNIIGYSESSLFEINNSSANKPFIRIFNDELTTANTITAPQYIFNLLVGNPKHSPVKINVYASVGNDKTVISSYNAIYDSIPHGYQVDLTKFPNSSAISLIFELTDGSVSVFDTTVVFAKENSRELITELNSNFISRYNKVKVEVRVVDNKKFTGDEYYITFNDTSLAPGKYFSVYNKTKGYFILKNAPLIPFNESVIFDGLTLYTEDITTAIDSTSRWSGNRDNNLRYKELRYIDLTRNIYGMIAPLDYAIVFSDSYTDSSNDLSGLLHRPVPVSKKLNFKIFDITHADDVRQIKFLFVSNSVPDTLSEGDLMLFSNPQGTLVSDKVLFLGGGYSYRPKQGDTLFLFSKKGLSIFDTLRIFGLPSDVTGTVHSVKSFALQQNYPNPFNPTTLINYDLPATLKVELKVFDIIGREVTTLVNGEQTPGTHSIRFDGARLSSGVYFYTLKAGQNLQTKKMVLIK